MNETETRMEGKKRGRKKNPVPIKIISLIFAFLMVLLPIAAYIIFEEDILDWLSGTSATYFKIGIPIVVGIFGLFATYFFYLGLRRKRIVRNKKDNSMLFKITSVAGIAGGVILGIITILYFLEDIIDLLDLSSSLDDKIVVCITLFGLLSPVLIYLAWGVFRKRKTRRAVIFSGMMACMLVGSTIFLGWYQDMRMGYQMRGPYLSWSEDPRTTISIAWESPGQAPKKLQWSTSTNFSSPNEVTATEWDYRARIERYHYNVTVRNLQPDTTYYYRIPGFHDEITPFKTAPNTTTAFRFFAYGDSREADLFIDNQHAALINQMQDLAAQTMPSLIINSGDIANSGNDVESWDAHFGAIKPLASKVPYFTGTGNHEWEDGPDLDNYHTLIHECPSSGPLQINETSFAFNYSNAFFIFLGYPHANSWDHQANDTILTWLNSTLAIANQTSDWIFLTWHEPPFTGTGGTRIDKPNLKDNICPYLHEYGVDVVFLGHDHNLQVQNITSANNNTGWNVTYIITGGGGASLYDIADPDKTWTGPDYFGETLYARKTYEFLCVDVDNTTATITAYDDKGDLLYQMTRFK
ncbi:MAG: purple acid phosphatase family protein [Candidatus Hodarchaeota archaeon]